MNTKRGMRGEVIGENANEKEHTNVRANACHGFASSVSLSSQRDGHFILISPHSTYSQSLGNYCLLIHNRIAPRDSPSNYTPFLGQHRQVPALGNFLPQHHLLHPSEVTFPYLEALL